MCSQHRFICKILRKNTLNRKIQKDKKKLGIIDIAQVKYRKNEFRTCLHYNEVQLFHRTEEFQSSAQTTITNLIEKYYLVIIMNFLSL